MRHEKLAGLQTPMERIANVAASAARSAREAATRTSGTISITNADGTRSILGALSSKSMATHVGDVTPPGRPLGISAASSSGVLVCHWSGELEGGIPDDFYRVVVYAANGTDSQLVGELYAGGSVTTNRLTVGEEYFVYATAEDDACEADGTPSHNVSPESDRVAVTITAAADPAVVEEAQRAADEAREAASSVARTRAIVASCKTAAGEPAKSATVADSFELAEGASVTVVFAEGNSAASPTLDVGGTGAAPILTGGANSAYWAAGAAVAFVFHGGVWNVASAPVYASTADVGDPGGRHVHVGAEYIDVMDGDKVQTRIGSDLIELGRDMDIPDDGDSTRSARVSMMNGVATFYATVMSVAKGVALKVLELATPILRVRTDKMVSLSARHDLRGSKEYSNVLFNAYVDLAEDSTGAEVGNAPVVSVTCAHRDASGTITDQTWAMTHEGIQGPGGAALPVYRAASSPQEADYAAARPCVVVCDDGTAWLIS